MRTSAESSEKELYVPVGNLKRASYRHLKIACLMTPDQECGKARRVGYIQQQGQRLALYRLMTQDGNPTGHRKTEPNLFILEQKVFKLYKIERSI
jgi:hypothetical protein